MRRKKPKEQFERIIEKLIMLKKEQTIMRNKLQITREVVDQLIFQRRNDELAEKR